MNVLFWGCDRPGSLKALSYLARNEMTIRGCICDNLSEDGLLVRHCHSIGIPTYNTAQLFQDIIPTGENPIDVGFSYCYHHLITADEIALCRHGIINFHPAPLPEHKGVAGCCYAIYKEKQEWGVTAHYINERFDEGPIIEVYRFPIPQKDITGIELSALIQENMYKLFQSVVKRIIAGEYPKGKQQSAEGFYYSRKNMESDRIIRETDDTNEINRKIEAFWFPPYHGATIELNGVQYTLVNSSVLKKIAGIFPEDFPAE